MELLGYGAAGLIGVTLGLMGGGGSILTVPVLVYLFDLSGAVATGYSLFIVGTTALIGALVQVRRKLVDLRAAGLFLAPSLLSVWAMRRWVVPHLPAQIGPLSLSQALLLLFALLMFVTAVTMLRGRCEAPAKAVVRPQKIALPALAVGAVTGLVGAGGGFLIVPALTLAAGLPIARAVATSLLVIAANALLGFVSDTTVRPHADWTLLLSVTAAAAVGMAVGSAAVRVVPAKVLRPAFAVFLLLMGTYMVVRELLLRHV